MLDKTNVVEIDAVHEMKKSFIAYAMAVNVSRAIPDVRDGLKPVHRRILFAMNELGLTSDKPFRKCALIVGDVLGKYHPHGDSSVYDALVRLAQDFSIRCTLVDGHGNFGSVDGDPAAAYRYTEARLSKIADEMTRGIDKKTVDFYPNFDDTREQPVVLPSRFPNLLVNGSDGIAVGMATSIPPHNLGEVIDGTVALLENPEIDIDGLMEYIPAPDYPTGAYIMGGGGIKKAYRTGRGNCIIRAKAEIEENENGGKSKITITEIPYQVNKARLIENMADLVKQKKIEGISDIHELSDKDGMRIVVDVKKDANPQVVLNMLYKHTQLQISHSMIMLALVEGTPKVLNLKQILEEYVKHQKDVIVRRTQYDLDKALEREHILLGLVKALTNIDEVIDTIKKSSDRQSAIENLMNNFELSDKQAIAILEMRLQRLT
ncbi:MAG: DNA gyrase subunit A, partial [Clostridia bacterium]|nr:DNA gyrase subunit A [Clostridia bacterium]